MSHWHGEHVEGRVPALSASGPGPARAPRTAPHGTNLYAAYAATHDDPAPDYRKYIAILIKQRWLIAGVAAISLAVGLAYTFLQTPVYRASATIQIERQAKNISGIAGLEQAEASRSGEFYQTQYELLKSRALAKRVVAKLGLREAMGVQAVLDGLSVEPVRASSIVRISFDSSDPRLAGRIADAVAETFIASNIERTFEASAYARQFLEKRLQELRLKLEESERELVAYAEQQNIVAAGSRLPLSAVNLAETNEALGEAAKQRLRHELRWRQGEASAGVDLPHSLETTALQELRAQRNELSLTYEQKLQDFKPAYPEMVRLRTRIDEIDRQIKAEADRIRTSLRVNHEASLKEEQALLGRMDELRSEVMDRQRRNIQYTILQREVDTNRSLYEGLLQRYKEIGVAGAIDSQNAASNVSIVDHAQVPTSPYTPRLGLNLAGAIVIGLVLGGLAAFGREYFDNSFHVPEDLEDGLGLPLLGAIPLSREATDIGRILDDQQSPQNEAYRSLRAALQFSTAAGTPKSILVTSALQSEGKSTAAVNLAAQCARIGLRVLVIDADLRKPSLHGLLGCDGRVGLSQYLAEASAPPAGLQPTALPDLTLLPGGPVPADPAGLLSGTRMAALIGAGSEEFDLVVVDGPPVGGLADAPLLASMCRGTLLVVEADNTNRGAVAAAVKRLQFARGKLIGVVLNKFDEREAGRAYGHGLVNGGTGYYGEA